MKKKNLAVGTINCTLLDGCKNDRALLVCKFDFEFNDLDSCIKDLALLAFVVYALGLLRCTSPPHLLQMCA